METIEFHSLGETFGDVACLSGVEKTDLLKISIEKSPSTSTGKKTLQYASIFLHFNYKEFQSNYQQPMIVPEENNDVTAMESRTV